MFELIEHNRVDSNNNNNNIRRHRDAYTFSRTHKSTVVVVAAVDIIRMHIFVVVVVVATVDIYQYTQIRWCVMYHLVQSCAIRCIINNNINKSNNKYVILCHPSGGCLN